VTSIHCSETYVQWLQILPASIVSAYNDYGYLSAFSLIFFSLLSFGVLGVATPDKLSALKHSVFKNCNAEMPCLLGMNRHSVGGLASEPSALLILLLCVGGKSLQTCVMQYPLTYLPTFLSFGH
jgi:hypothetical protein